MPRFAIVIFIIADLVAIWAVLPNKGLKPLEPYEVQLVSQNQVYRLFPAKIDQKEKVVERNGKIFVRGNWSHDGFSYVANDYRFGQPEPMINPTSLEIKTKPGRKFMVRSSILPTVLSESFSGWRVKADKAKVQKLDDGSLRVKVDGQNVTIEAFGPKSKDSLTLKAKQVYIWGVHESKNHLGH